MEVFEKAFNCKRKQDFRRREFSSLNSLLSNGIPDFLAFYTLAQTSYTNGNYSDALSFIDKTIKLIVLLFYKALITHGSIFIISSK